MKSVVVDGEEVKFEGDVPADPSQMYGLLMDALSEQSRVIVSFVVDGKDTLKGEEIPSAYDKIEATSLTHDELTFRLTLDSMNKLSETEGQLNTLVGNPRMHLCVKGFHLDLVILPFRIVYRRLAQLSRAVLR